MTQSIIFVLLLLNISVVLSQDCNLPNGQKSKCTRLIYCNHFAMLLRNYGGKPPQDVQKNIREHECPQPKGTVCCPDNVQLAPPQEPPRSSIVDYNSLRSHRNFNLLNDRKCGQSTSDRIVGGWDAQLNEIPWLALLGFVLRSDFSGTITWGCGGALISSRYVLTASHCITKDLKKVRLGEHTISTERDCDDFKDCADPVQDIPVEKFIKHPQFDRYKRKNDIALIKLASPALTSQNNIRTICVPVDAADDIDTVLKNKKNRIPMTISGFGKIGNSGKKHSDVLQKAFVPYVNRDDCQKRYESINISIDKWQFCAGGLNLTDTCSGDSGGPITNIGSKPRMMLYGVVVGGIACESEGNQIIPGVYTDIRPYLPWILDNINP